ncbi:MAG TPA: D-aminoacyl-tRNA deacylase, partial [Thermoanaerobaculia bacterium]
MKVAGETVGAIGRGLLVLVGVERGDRPEAARAAAEKSITEAGHTAPGLVGFITDDLLPTSFVQPFVENEILQILVLAILVAAAVSMLAEGMRQSVISVFEVLSRIVFGVIRLIMWVAPLGAFGGM